MILKLFIKTENNKSKIINKLIFFVIGCVVISIVMIFLNRIGFSPIVLLQKIFPIIRNLLPL